MITSSLKLIFSLFSLLICSIVSGQSLTIEGKVLDSDGELLDQATVQIINLNENLFTDSYGKFSIEFEVDDIKELNFRINYTGCDQLDTTIREIHLLEPITFHLSCSSQLEEVVIQSFYPVKRNTSTVVTVDKIKNQPVLFGEPDVYKTLQSMPGINFGVEGSADLVVRGGSVSENLYILDNIPMYSGSHLFGLMTPINGDLLDEVNVYKNGFPAQYGGRLSSVVDMKSIPFEKIDKTLNLRVGLLSNAVQYSDHIGENVAFDLSARRTLLDQASKLVTSVILDTEEAIIPAFGDVYGKISTKIGDNHYLHGSLLWTQDRLSISEKSVRSKEESLIRWQTPSVLIGYSKVTDRSRITLDVGNSEYRYLGSYFYEDRQLLETIQEKESFNIRDQMLTGHLQGSYKLTDELVVTGGSIYSWKKYQILNEFEEFGVQSGDTISQRSQTWQNYASVNFEKPWTSSSLGLHVISLPGDYFLTMIGPRLYLDYRRDDSKWYLTWSRMHQTDHLIANRSIGNYLKTWIPSSSKFPPAKSDEYGLGYSWSFQSGSINAEVYYKKRSGLVHPQEGDLNFITEENINNLLKDGEGIAKGIEVSGLWYIGSKHKIEASYALSKSTLRFPDLNNGESFSDYFDRRHNVKVAYSWDLSDAWKIHSQFTLLTGAPFTYMQGMYPGLMYDPAEASRITGSVPYNTILYFDGLNNRRLPVHHRVDISAQKKLKSKRWPSILGFGVYNAYARINPMYVEVGQKYKVLSSGQIKGNQLEYNLVSYFNFIPYVNISINFW